VGIAIAEEAVAYVEKSPKKYYKSKPKKGLNIFLREKRNQI